MDLDSNRGPMSPNDVLLSFIQKSTGETSQQAISTLIGHDDAANDHAGTSGANTQEANEHDTSNTQEINGADILLALADAPMVPSVLLSAENQEDAETSETPRIPEDLILVSVTKSGRKVMKRKSGKFISDVGDNTEILVPGKKKKKPKKKSIKPKEPKDPNAPDEPKKRGPKKKFNEDGTPVVRKKKKPEGRPFKCDVCGKCYAWAHHLRDHQRLHTGDKPFKCKFCDKMFRRRDVRKAHENTHTGEKPFECSICGQRFAQDGSLHTHKKKHAMQNGEIPRVPRKTSNRSRPRQPGVVYLTPEQQAEQQANYVREKWSALEERLKNQTYDSQIRMLTVFEQVMNEEERGNRSYYLSGVPNTNSGFQSPILTQVPVQQVPQQVHVQPIQQAQQVMNTMTIGNVNIPSNSQMSNFSPNYARNVGQTATMYITNMSYFNNL